VAQNLRKWLARTGVKTLYIRRASSWENGDWEYLNSKFRDEFPNIKIFYSLKEVRVISEWWRVFYNRNRRRACSSLGYKLPPVEWRAETKKEYGKVANREGFALSHTPDSYDGSYLLTAAVR
jgi:putative transposase